MDNFFNKLESFIEIYLIIAAIYVFSSFFYNLIIRSI